MKIKTRKFGEIEIDENKILFMPLGLPGFPGFEKFIIIEDKKNAPFCWFQSVQEPDLALVVMNPFIFKPDYEINLKDFIASRGWKDVEPEDLLIYVVINVSKQEKKKKITANLVGPLIINYKNNEAVQVAVADAGYSHQHNVLEAQ